jgi:hypothetical protein
MFISLQGSGKMKLRIKKLSQSRFWKNEAED